MALGPVSVGGSGYTHAAIDLLLKKAMYSDGKLLYTGFTSFSYSSDGKLTLPDEVDYVKLTCTNCDGNTSAYEVPAGTKLARGSSIRTASNGAAISFSADGILKFVGYNATYKPDGASYLVEGYHYY